MLDLILNKLKYTNDDEANLIISRLRYQIETLEERLAKEQASHRRTRAVYRRVIDMVRLKFIGVDEIISYVAKEYDKK